MLHGRRKCLYNSKNRDLSPFRGSMEGEIGLALVSGNLPGAANEYRSKSPPDPSCTHEGVLLLPPWAIPYSPLRSAYLIDLPLSRELGRSSRSSVR